MFFVEIIKQRNAEDSSWIISDCDRTVVFSGNRERTRYEKVACSNEKSPSDGRRAWSERTSFEEKLR